ncbi:MAG TPA: hypothetical protein QGF58_05220 [Myxococcota bacterium]|nr:hypothetical protein [Myxococcota bacterium]
MFWLLLIACLPRYPEQVEALADAASTDPVAAEKLVKTLKSDDELIWRTAYRELLVLGPPAVAPLREAVLRNRPEGPRALLVLGAMGDPSNFDVIRAALDVPGMTPFAEEAFERGEIALWERIQDDPSVAICDDYLDWFPRGPMAPEVEELRYQADAWDSYEEMGRKPTDGQLLSFARDWPDTDAERKARARLSSRAINAAEDAIVDGRPEYAIELLARARDVDPSARTRLVEARAHEAIARRAASSNDLDSAITELERARALGSGDPTLLAGLYLKRAHQRFERLQPAGAMRDLGRAEELSPGVRSAVVDMRQRKAESLLVDLKARGSSRDEAPLALFHAGRGFKQSAETEVLAAVAEGDIVPLEGLVVGARDEEQGSLDARLWSMTVLDQALQNQNAAVRALLADTEGLRSMLQPVDMWSREARLSRRESLGIYRTYLRTVELAVEEVRAGGRIISPLPSAEPLPEYDVVEVLRAGGSPLQERRAMLHRVQLLVNVLEGPERVSELARKDPVALARAFIGSTEMPTELIGWRLHVAEASVFMGGSPHRVGLSGGSSASLSVQRSPTAIVFRFDLDGSEVHSDDLSDAMSVLFGCSRVLLHAEPAIDAIDVVMHAGGEEKVWLSLPRSSAARLNWTLVLAEAPYTTDHLAFVLDQRIR